jgi:hypothetical protein
MYTIRDACATDAYHGADRPNADIQLTKVIARKRSLPGFVQAISQ